MSNTPFRMNQTLSFLTFRDHPVGSAADHVQRETSHAAWRAPVCRRCCVPSSRLLKAPGHEVTTFDILFSGEIYRYTSTTCLSLQSNSCPRDKSSSYCSGHVELKEPAKCIRMHINFEVKFTVLKSMFPDSILTPHTLKPVVPLKLLVLLNHCYRIHIVFCIWYTCVF